MCACVCHNFRLIHALGVTAMDDETDANAIERETLLCLLSAAWMVDRMTGWRLDNVVIKIEPNDNIHSFMI